MVLADLIDHMVEDILEDWSEFARRLGVTPEKLSDQQRRNSAREILLHIANDMRTAQSAVEQVAKSKGEVREQAPELADVARTHADDRLAHGFTLEELVSEYRALRATVIRLWQAQPYPVNDETIHQMVRFNEAIDQALTESIARYSASANRLRDLFNGILAHDLRSPLGAIHNSAQYLLRDEALGASSTKAAAAVLRSADRMKQMVNDLLDFSRIRLGDTLPMTPTIEDLQRISHQAVEEVCASYPSFQVDEQYEGSMLGTWDGARLGQLLTNLLVNAAQHGNGNAVLVARCVEHEVVVTVSNGGEIPADKIDKIFDPLIRSVTTSRKGTAAGVGLGLYIAKAIVKTHGGTIEVECGDGSTTLAVKLPRHCPMIGWTIPGPAAKTLRSLSLVERTKDDGQIRGPFCVGISASGADWMHDIVVNRWDFFQAASRRGDDQYHALKNYRFTSTVTPSDELLAAFEAGGAQDNIFTKYY